MNLKLGTYVANAPAKTTPLGIVYWPRGCDDYGQKRVQKTCNRMVEAGVQPHIIDEFRAWALLLPTELPTWIDAAYTERITDWRSCIGKKLPNGKTITAGNVNKVTPRYFQIFLHPRPFLMTGRTEAGLVPAAAWDTRIEVLTAYLSDSNTWFRRCDKLIVWEIGNLISRNCGFSPMDVNQEIGHRRPCSG